MAIFAQVFGPSAFRTAECGLNARRFLHDEPQRVQAWERIRGIIRELPLEKRARTPGHLMTRSLQGGQLRIDHLSWESRLDISGLVIRANDRVMFLASSTDLADAVLKWHALPGRGRNGDHVPTVLECVRFRLGGTESRADDQSDEPGSDW